jgi:hypothetical protein
MSSLQELIALLQKISRTTDKVQVQVNYNGVDFNWKVPIVNMKESEYLPRHKKECRDHEG